VSPRDDHDPLALGRDERSFGDRIALTALILELEVLHCEVDAAQLAPRHLEIARPAGAPGQDDRVELAPQLGDGTLTPTWLFGRKATPSFSMSCSRRSR